MWNTDVRCVVQIPSSRWSWRINLPYFLTCRSLCAPYHTHALWLMKALAFWNLFPLLLLKRNFMTSTRILLHFSCFDLFVLYAFTCAHYFTMQRNVYMVLIILSLVIILDVSHCLQNETVLEYCFQLKVIYTFTRWFLVYKLRKLKLSVPCSRKCRNCNLNEHKIMS
jgi:hypothetical protein